MKRLCLIERWSTATNNVKLDEWRVRADSQKYPPIAMFRSARCFVRTRDKKRTCTEAEIDGITDKDEADTAEESSEMLGDAVGEDDGDEATMAL